MSFLKVLCFWVIILVLFQNNFPQSIPVFQNFATDKSDNIFAGSTKGIYKSSDGGITFTPFGLLGFDIEDIEIPDGNSFYVSTYTDSGVFKSTNSGASWIYSGLSNQYAINDLLFDSSGFLIAASHQDYIWRSSDSGTTWQRSNTLNIANRVYALQLYSGNTIYAANAGGISRSTDHGLNWLNVFVTPSFATCLTAGVTGLLYTGGLSNMGVFRSSDGGSTWMKSDSGMTNKTIMSILAVNNIVLAGTFGGGIFKSTDSGVTWTSSGLAGKRIYGLGRKNSGRLFAGSDSGIVFSNDNGITWQSSSVITSAQESSLIFSSDYKLGQNYPNPFNPVTSISYSIPHDARVVVKIFDMMGREVMTLLNEDQSIGLHTVNFDAGNLSSGVYFYQIKSSHFRETKKMMLVR